MSKIKINNAFILYNHSNILLNNYVSPKVQELSEQNSLKDLSNKKEKNLGYSNG